MRENAAGDPVALGLVASLARPGGNITGSVYFGPELAAKRLDLLKEAFPRIKRVGVLQNPDNPASAPNLHALRITAEKLKLGLEHFEVRSAQDFERAFAAIAKARVDAIEIVDDPVLSTNVKPLAELAAQRRLPAIGRKEFAESGGAIGYGVNAPEMYRRAAYFVDRILKGARPGDLPVEQATKFELVINQKTANALGIKIPQSVLVRADRVIE